MLASDHRHCKVCGKVVRTGQETCSDTCASERQRRLGSARTSRYVLYGLILFVVVLFAIGYLGV